MTILLVTKKTEENALRLTEICEHMGIPSIKITPEDYCSSRMSLTTAIEQGIGSTNKIIVHRPGGPIDVDLHDITGVWTRGLDFGVKPSRHQYAENLIYHEWKYHISYLVKAIDKSKWVNWPTAMQNIANKPYQLQLAERFGFNVPSTIVTNSVSEAKEFFRKQNKVIVKVIGEGMPAETADRGLFTQVVDSVEYLDQIEVCPTMLQQAIEKKYDLRVTVIDGVVYAAALKHGDIDDSPIDSRETNALGESYFRYSMHAALSSAIAGFVHSLDLRYAAIDLVVDRHDNVYFLEINNVGQWSYIEYMTGYPISEAIVRGLCHESEGIKNRIPSC